MSSEAPQSNDLLDLKLLPAWVKETEAPSYEHYTGEEGAEREGRRGKRRPPRGRDRTAKPGAGTPSGDARPDGEKFRGREQRRQPPGSRDRDRRPRRPEHGKKDDRHRAPGRAEDRPQPTPQLPPPDIAIRFLPRTPVFDNVVEQIKSGPVAYSLFHLARLFLEKPERYEVHLKPKPVTPLFQAGEGGAVSLNQQFLEQNAFQLAHENFYKIDITQGEPIKGNFSSVARDRLSGTLLGPTSYHGYQPRLRTLYEQRFSRRMSFSDYQRQIENVSDPALVERWKEETQRVTTYTTVREDPPVSFTSVADAERHFREHYLSDLVRSVEEAAIGGVQSRRLRDRALNGAIENAWAREIRSPSQMMQELASRLRETELHIFRHRRGMLFVSSIWPRLLKHEEAGVSPQVKAILDLVTATPGIGRKELADKLIVDVPAEEAEPRKLSLASDLHWLISAGYVIEFNDGSLDLPRAKAKAAEAEKKAEEVVAADAPTADEKPAEVGAIDSNRPSQPVQTSTAGSSGEPPLPETSESVGAGVPAAEKHMPPQETEKKPEDVATAAVEPATAETPVEDRQEKDAAIPTESNAH